MENGKLFRTTLNRNRFSSSTSACSFREDFKKSFTIYENSQIMNFENSNTNKALFTRYKLTRVSFCRVNTANPGSTRVSLSCKHY